MRIEDAIFFAPGVRFEEVAFSSPELPELFVARISAYYLHPAASLAAQGHAFGAGVLLVASIDALARFKYGAAMGVGDRFRTFAEKDLAGFPPPHLPQRLYDEFRNGLVHEARIKKGSQFSFDFGKTVEFDQTHMVINPSYLLKELEAALAAYHQDLTANAAARMLLANQLTADHATDPQPPPP